MCTEKKKEYSFGMISYVLLDVLLLPHASRLYLSDPLPRRPHLISSGWGLSRLDCCCICKSSLREFSDWVRSSRNCRSITMDSFESFNR